MKLATLALHIAPDPPPNRPRTLSHPAYLREILSHAGLFYEEIPRDQVIRSSGYQVIILTGDAALTQDEGGALEAWIEAGGSLIGIGSHSGQPALFGVREDKQESVAGWGVGVTLLGEGYGR